MSVLHDDHKGLVLEEVLVVLDDVGMVEHGEHFDLWTNRRQFKGEQHDMFRITTNGRQTASVTKILENGRQTASVTKILENGRQTASVTKILENGRQTASVTKILENGRQTASVTKMREIAKWQTLQRRRKLQKLIVFYKTVNTLI